MEKKAKAKADNLIPDETQENQIREENTQGNDPSGPQEEKPKEVPLLTMCPALKTIPLPTHYVFSDNKLAKEILEMRIGEKHPLENVMPGINSFAIISDGGETGPRLRGAPITGYDLWVLYSIDSYFNEEAYYQSEEGILFKTYTPKEVTAAQIWRAGTRTKGSRTPSPEQIELVRQSVEKLSRILIAINCKEELEKCLKKKGVSLKESPMKDGKIVGSLLSLEKFKGYSGGKFVDAYRIMGASPIYTYNNLIGQERSVEADLLAITDERGRRIPDNQRRIIIKLYLLSRVEIMKHIKANKKQWAESGASNKKHWNRILYATLYEEIAKRIKNASIEINKETDAVFAVWEQAPDATKGKNGREIADEIRKYTFQVFDHWRRYGYIKGITPDPAKKYIDVKL